MLYVMDGSKRSIIGLKMHKEKIDQVLIAICSGSAEERQEVLFDAIDACFELGIPYKVAPVPYIGYANKFKRILFLFSALLTSSYDTMFLGFEESFFKFSGNGSAFDYDYDFDVRFILEKFGKDCSLLSKYIHTVIEGDDSFYRTKLEELEEYV